MNNPLPSTKSTDKPTFSIRRILISMLKIILIVYIVWLILMYLTQDKMLYPAGAAPKPLPTLSYANTEVLTLDIPEGEVVAWLIPPRNAAEQSNSNPWPLAIFFHGNAEIIDYPYGIVEMYHSLGYAVLLPEFRGYGRSAGKPSQDGITQDMIHFYDTVAKRSDIDSSRIIFHGRSLGGGVAAQLAARRKPAAMILQSTFTSVASMAWRYAAPPVLVKNPYHTDHVLAKADYPVLIFHGTKDRIIPVSHGRTLAKLTTDKQSRYFEFSCGHNDFPGAESNHQIYYLKIKSFLETLEPVTSPSSLQ